MEGYEAFSESLKISHDLTGGCGFVNEDND